MANESSLISVDIAGYLHAHEHKSMLRLITCGSVDDGKSTLIGRLLYDSHLVFDDHLASLREDSRKVGTQGGELDFALLLDGLTAEREQGITIDVAYRYFSTELRKFIVADTPGHEQYTRNMVTGASTADLAVILVDARKGVLTQTRRHSYLTSLLGIKRVVLAVNKMDLVGFSQDRFDEIENSYREFVSAISPAVSAPPEIIAIPLSALRGDNITTASPNIPWYVGPTLLHHLETVPIDADAQDRPFRLPVQWVNRPHLDFRGFSGTIIGGSIRPGERVRVLPSGTETFVARVVTMSGDLAEGVCGQSVTLTFTDEVDASRGDVVCSAESPAEVADQFEAHVVWMSEQPMLVGRPYVFKGLTRSVGVSVTHLKYKVNVNTLEHVAAATLAMNEIGVCNLSLDRPVAFDAYAQNRDMGSFIVIDRVTNATVGAGLLHFALRRSHNIHLQAVQVDKAARRALNGHGGAVVWFTGLSGSGKSTVASLVEKRLHGLGVHTYLLDGDKVRHGLNKDLGFTDADRVENIRRVGEVARLMVDASQVVLVALISPFAEDRQMARSLVGPDEFCEVFVDAPLEVTERRDPKGLYRKARRGELPHFTGIDSPYEAPMHPELRIDTVVTAPEDAVELVLVQLRRMGVIPA